ncbi:MAG: hypothetical protein NWP51_10805, partial [Marinomonas hwangdonensis]|nr:hypothetical protein [Marinomonas hwangdonensis]
MKLIHKFFFAFFIASMALVGLMFVFIYLTFSTGFNQFIEQEEQKHVDAVKQQLIELYSQSNSWQPIEQNTLLWRSIVEQNVEPGVEKDPSLNGGGESAKDRQAKGKQDSPSPAFLWINL